MATKKTRKKSGERPRTAEARKKQIAHLGKNCAINEQTGDGATVGRCMFFVGEVDMCPRHGDVTSVMRHYRETGKLTLERLFREERTAREERTSESVLQTHNWEAIARELMERYRVSPMAWCDLLDKHETTPGAEERRQRIAKMRSEDPLGLGHLGGRP